MFEFLSYRRMLTPWLLQILFWLAVIICIIAGIEQIHQQPSVWFGIGIIIIGPIVCRIISELIMVAFRINETLTDIRNKMVE